MSDDQQPEQQQWALVLAFDTDEPEFTRGVEVGIIWKATEDGRPWEGLVSAANTEMVIRIAEARGLSFRAHLAGDSGEWYQVTLAARPGGEGE